MRNLVWLGKQYCENKLLFYIQMAKSLIKNILGIILFDDNKIHRILMVIEAYKNGLSGNFDNFVPQKILYRNKYENKA
jgi:hypothetical protein